MRRQISLFGLAFLSALAVGGCGQSTSQESLVASQQRSVTSGSGTVALTIASDWGSGYCASVTVANQGTAPITSWKVVMQLPNASLSNLWSAEYTMAGDLLTTTGLSGSGAIPGGGSTTFGFCSTTTSATNHTPVIVSLDVVGGDIGGSGGAAGTGGSSATAGASQVGGSSAGGSASTGVAVLDVNSDWKSGYCTNITLKNTGTVASTDWTLVLNVPQANISDLWSGSYTRNGNSVTVKPASNAAINPGQSISLGYCAVTTGTSYQPSVTSFVLVTSAPGTGGATSTGGTSATGGATSTGGSPPTGGTSATGGKPPTGGSPPTGGTPATGGKPPTGGSPPTGGTSATGGTPPTGGSPPTGGTSATGGKPPTGGSPPTGGTPATGGKPSTGGSTATGGASSQGAVTAALKITSDWGGGYCASVDVINGSSRQVTNWTVKMNFPLAQLTNAWSGTATVANSVLSVAAASYNQNIAPGASVNFGFCATATGANHTPTVSSVSVTN